MKINLLIIWFNILLFHPSMMAMMSTPSLKVYLYDVNKKPIKKAKVTLEGMDIIPIFASYDKKDGFYFFKKLPEKYDTVLASHSKYNPKGFKKNEKWPSEITIELYNPYRVRIPGDTANYYMEDPYKLVVGISGYNDKGDYSEKRLELAEKSLDRLAQKHDLEKLNNNQTVENCCFDQMVKKFLVYIKEDKTRFKRNHSQIVQDFRNNEFTIYAGFFLYQTVSGSMEIVNPKGKIVYNLLKNYYDLTNKTLANQYEIWLKKAKRLRKIRQPSPNKEDHVTTIFNFWDDLSLEKVNMGMSTAKCDESVVLSTSHLNISIFDKTDKTVKFFWFPVPASSEIEPNLFKRMQRFSMKEFTDFKERMKIYEIIKGENITLVNNDKSIGLGIHDQPKTYGKLPFYNLNIYVFCEN